MKGKKEYTFAEFAKKIGVARDTVYRWNKLKRLRARFKMYDAEIVTVSGKRFIRIIK